MRSYRFGSVLTAILTSVLLGACTGDGDGAANSNGTGNVDGGDDESSSRSESPVQNESSTGDVAVCLKGAPFVADGIVPIDDGAPSTADEVRGLRWENHDGCGRFVIDFAAEDDSPAQSAGNVRAEVIRDLAVVRIELPDVQNVNPEATEAAFDGLADAAYSVWSAEGRWVYVDLHLAEAAEAYVAVLEDPARVVVDLRPGGPAIPPPPASDERIVVLEPREREQTYPLKVTGYARTFEANVVARLERDGEEIEETFTTATAWAEAWGHYSMTFEEGPSGSLRLHVGEHSARNGTWEGAVVDLEMQ